VQPISQTGFLPEGVPQGTRLMSWEPSTWPVADDWRAVTEHFLTTEVAQHLGRFIRARLESGAVIYPPMPFRALELTSLQQVRVVILGQDPYHGLGQAHGLAFSVPPGIRVPPSLRNIFKEIVNDPLLGCGRREQLANGSLERWARQGVLLLNTCLTVEDGKPASHAKKGWEVLTDFLIEAVLERSEPVVFMLWGAHAQTKRALMGLGENADPKPHPNTRSQPPSSKAPRLVLVANHPSPLSALRPPLPFAGCGHFGQANQFLVLYGQSAIDW
jgi:uracil-DNA glycosylase